MKNFQDRDNRGGFRGGSGGARPSFHKKPWEGGRGDDKEKVMFQATCSECHKSCEVPFRPSGEKPVYCRDCFNSKRDSNDSRGGGRSDFGNRGPRKDFAKPSFSPSPRTDFKPAHVATAPGGEFNQQLAEISAKLDRLITALIKKPEVKNEAPIAKVVPLKTVIKKATEAKASKTKVAKKKK